MQLHALIAKIEERRRRGGSAPTLKERHDESLKQIFQEFNMKEEENKELFDTLIEWKRTL